MLPDDTASTRVLTMRSPLLLDLPAVIETERLLMRPPQPGDGPIVFEAVRESLPELRLFLASLPWVAGEQSVAASESWCRSAQANFLLRKDLPFLLFEKGTHALVGASGLHRPVWETPKVEVGYWGRTSRRGNGFVAEGVNALVQYAFDRIGAVRVELVTDEANARARKVAERCRFALEGILRDERRAPDGTLRSMCIYARHPTAGGA